MSKKPAKRRKSQPRKKSTAVAVVNKNDAMTLSLSNPAQIIEFGKVLNTYIKKNNLSVVIDGKDYPLCGAWKFAGANFGLTAVPTDITPKHKEGQYVTLLYIKKEFEARRKDGSVYKYTKEVPIFSGFTHHEDVIEKIRKRFTISKETVRPYYAYECKVDIKRISDDHVVSSGTSVCSNMETLKAGFDEFAVMGQAQTRTISRGYRNLLDYVLQAAGMEPTPGEEAEGVVEANESFEQRAAPDKDTPKVVVIKKQKMSVEQLKKYIARAQAGEKILDKAREHFEMTDAQEKALDMVENKEKYQQAE